LKIAWIVDAWPLRPSRAWTDSTAVDELSALGNEVLVVAAAVEPTDAHRDLRVHALPRNGASREHWQRSASASVHAALRALLRAERPDVVHVHHWRSLTRDLVFAAAREGVPAVVSLHDVWATCLIGTRILPRTGAACDAVLGAHPCIACAPRTPWVPIEAQYMSFAEHRADVVRELRLARAVLVQDRARAAEIRRFLGEDGASLPPFVEADSVAGHPARVLTEIYAAARASGAPDVRPSDGDWYSERMKSFAESEWERGAEAAGFLS
jgi:glycosyltransferase involved in cell wall biosynthesis